MSSEIKMKMKIKSASKMEDGRSEMGKWWKAGGERVRERECERERGIGSQLTGMSGGIK